MRISEIKQNAMAKEPRLSWLWITFRGTHALVEVQERALPNPEDVLAPRDMVAAKPGIITHIAVLEGTPCVQIGDTVTQGQMLIDRTMPTLRTTRADGIVTARTWHTLRETAYLTIPQYTVQDEATTAYALLWNRRLWTFGRTVSAPHAITTVHTKRLYLFETLPLPIFLLSLHTQALAAEPHTIELPQAVRETETLLLHRLTASLPPGAVYQSHRIKTEFSSDAIITVTLTAEVLENIATPSR